MYFASNGYTKFTIELGEAIKIRAYEVLPELLHTSKAIANSLLRLLQYEIKQNPNPDKESVVIAYLEKLGWRVKPG